MHSAQESFLQRIAVFSRTLNSSFLKDNGVTQNAHNEKARILRNGISIIAFTILEDFIKDRIGEILQRIGSSTFQFNLLPDIIQKASTLGAMQSILYKANLMRSENDDWLAFIQNETKHIASSANYPFSFSKFSIGWGKSNLGKDDIPRFLKIFNVKGGWNTIQQITAKANSTLISPEDVFSNAAQRRHKAAHNPNSNSLFTDLEEFSRDIKSLSFAFDVLISKGVSQILKRDVTAITPSIIKLRFLIKDGNLWKEYNSEFRKSLRSDSNYNRLLAKVLRRAIRRDEVVIVKRDLREIHNWFIPI